MTDCPNPECEDGLVPDPTACGDEDHCAQLVPCPICSPADLSPTT